MEQHLYAEMAEREERHWWFVARRTLVAEILSRLPNLPAAARILEAGCGTGGNLAMLGRFGRVSALEPNAEARDRARQKGDFDVREGSLPDGIPFAPGSFDLVVALDVLEHLDDDGAALRALRAQLRPAGRLLVTVPAFPSLWSVHDELNHHRRRYRRAQLTSSLRKAGLAVGRATHFNSFLFPAIFAVRLAERFLGRTTSAAETPSPRTNALLRWIFESERHLLPFLSLPFGVSLLALARKS